MSGLKISEKDYMIVMFAQVISDHFGTLNPAQHMELAEKIYDAMLDYAKKTEGRASV